MAWDKWVLRTLRSTSSSSSIPKTLLLLATAGFFAKSLGTPARREIQSYNEEGYPSLNPSVFRESYGRNIRPLACQHKETSQSGVCMFAWDCMKANGTHLGTCIDRFYFGSCCDLGEKTESILSTASMRPPLRPTKPPIEATDEIKQESTTAVPPFPTVPTPGTVPTAGTPSPAPCPAGLEALCTSTTAMGPNDEAGSSTPFPAVSFSTLPPPSQPPAPMWPGIGSSTPSGGQADSPSTTASTFSTWIPTQGTFPTVPGVSSPNPEGSTLPPVPSSQAPPMEINLPGSNGTVPQVPEQPQPPSKDESSSTTAGPFPAYPGQNPGQLPNATVPQQPMIPGQEQFPNGTNPQQPAPGQEQFNQTNPMVPGQMQFPNGTNPQQPMLPGQDQFNQTAPTIPGQEQFNGTQPMQPVPGQDQFNQTQPMIPGQEQFPNGTNPQQPMIPGQEQFPNATAPQQPSNSSQSDSGNPNPNPQVPGQEQFNVTNPMVPGQQPIPGQDQFNPNNSTLNNTQVPNAPEGPNPSMLPPPPMPNLPPQDQIPGGSDQPQVPMQNNTMFPILTPPPPGATTPGGQSDEASSPATESTIFPTLAPLNFTTLPPPDTLPPLNFSTLPPPDTLAPINWTTASTPSGPNDEGDGSSTTWSTLGTLAPINFTTLPPPDTLPPLNFSTLPPPDTLPPLNFSTLPPPDTLAPINWTTVAPPGEQTTEQRDDESTSSTFATLAPLNFTTLPPPDTLPPLNFSTLPPPDTLPPLNFTTLPPPDTLAPINWTTSSTPSGPNDEGGDASTWSTLGTLAPLNFTTLPPPDTLPPLNFSTLPPPDTLPPLNFSTLPPPDTLPPVNFTTLPPPTTDSTPPMEIQNATFPSIGSSTPPGEMISGDSPSTGAPMFPPINPSGVPMVPANNSGVPTIPGIEPSTTQPSGPSTDPAAIPSQSTNFDQGQTSASSGASGASTSFQPVATGVPSAGNQIVGGQQTAIQGGVSSIQSQSTVGSSIQSQSSSIPMGAPSQISEIGSSSSAVADQSTIFSSVAEQSTVQDSLSSQGGGVSSAVNPSQTQEPPQTTMVTEVAGQDLEPSMIGNPSDGSALEPSMTDNLPEPTGAPNDGETSTPGMISTPVIPGNIETSYFRPSTNASVLQPSTAFPGQSTSVDNQFGNYSSVPGGVPVVPTSSSGQKIPVKTDVPSETGSSGGLFEIPGSEIDNSLNMMANGSESPSEDAFFSENGTLLISDYKQICGRRFYPTSRIVGGKEATYGKWPWQVSLRQWRTSTYLHKCGAALLNENWAITAAHCVEKVPPTDLLLRIGEFDLSEDREPYGYVERRVQIVATHPQFDARTFEYDLALLRFYEPVVFQPNIVPICVPDRDEDFLEKTAYVTGWGRLYEDGPLPSRLQEVPVPIITNEECEQMYRMAGYIEHIPNIFICAGWRAGGKDSCEGDSGGPLSINRADDNRWVLGGVISWGIGCAEPNQPGVYTRISEFRHWINQILQF